jgi:hypothetical protein
MPFIRQQRFRIPQILDAKSPGGETSPQANE